MSANDLSQVKIIKVKYTNTNTLDVRETINVKFVNANALSVRGTVGSLTNVYEEEKTDGNTLVYYSANTTYVLQSPNNLNITTIDGGEF